MSTCHWEGRYVSNESRLVSMLSWWLCCVDHVFRLMFSRWCLLACKLILSTPRCRKTPRALMKHKMWLFSWREKRLCWHHFQSCINLFSRLMVFLVCDKMSQESFCSHCRVDCVDVKEFTRGTWFLVGRLAIFQAQIEQWVSSSQRTVVEGHSQLQCKACQDIQVIVKKTFQVE